MRFKTEPFDCQLKAFTKAWDKKAFAFLMEQGTGKTKVALDVAANLFFEKKIGSLIVVAPNGVHQAWVKDQIPQHFPIESILTRIYLYNSKTEGTKKAQRYRDLFLNERNPELFRILAINVEALLTHTGLTTVQALLKRTNGMLVVDEAGKILKTTATKTKRRKVLLQCGQMAKYKYILTGTPITKSPLDVYGQFEFLGLHILGFSNFISFRAAYANVEYIGPPLHKWPSITSYKNIDNLIQRIEPFSYRVLKKDCLDLPPKIYTKHYYDLTTQQLELYSQLRRDSVAFPGAPSSEAELIEAMQSDNMTLANNALLKLLRLRQLVGGFMKLENGNMHRVFDNDGDNPRIKAVLDSVEEIDGKIIIWSCFVEEIKALLGFFGKTAVGYYGAINSENRAKNLEQFKTDPTIKFFVANQECGGTGLTINEAAAVVYFSNDFKLENRLQSEDRCHRIGQDKSVVYIDIIANDSIDEHILKNLNEKVKHSVLLDNLK